MLRRHDIPFSKRGLVYVIGFERESGQQRAASAGVLVCGSALHAGALGHTHFGCVGLRRRGTAFHPRRSNASIGTGLEVVIYVSMYLAL